MHYLSVSLTAFTAAVTALLVLTSCSRERAGGPVSESLVLEENKNGVHVRTKDGSLSIEGNEKQGRITIKAKTGESVEVDYSQGNDLSPNFPQDIPVYRPSTITMSRVLKRKAALGSFTTTDNPETVIGFYKKELPEHGWKLDDAVSLGTMVMLRGGKKGHVLNVSILTGNEETVINLAKTLVESSP